MFMSWDFRVSLSLFKEERKIKQNKATHNNVPLHAIPCLK